MSNWFFLLKLYLNELTFLLLEDYICIITLRTHTHTHTHNARIRTGQIEVALVGSKQKTMKVFLNDILNDEFTEK